MRLGKVRERILELVRKSSGHLSADKIHQELRASFPRLSLATVYRNLKVLKGGGLIVGLDLGSGRKHYDRRRAVHAHAACVRCGAIFDVEFAEIGLFGRHRG